MELKGSLLSSYRPAQGPVLTFCPLQNWKNTDDNDFTNILSEIILQKQILRTAY